MNFLVFLSLTGIFFGLVFLSFFVLRKKKTSIWFWIWFSSLFHSLFLLDWQRFLESQTINLSPLATISNRTVVATGLKSSPRQEKSKSLVFLLPNTPLKKPKPQLSNSIHTEIDSSKEDSSKEDLKKDSRKENSPEISLRKKSLKEIPSKTSSNSVDSLEFSPEPSTLPQKQNTQTKSFNVPSKNTSTRTSSNPSLKDENNPSQKKEEKSSTQPKDPKVDSETLISQLSPLSSGQTEYSSKQPKKTDIQENESNKIDSDINSDFLQAFLQEPSNPSVLRNNDSNPARTNPKNQFQKQEPKIKKKLKQRLQNQFTQNTKEKKLTKNRFTNRPIDQTENKESEEKKEEKQPESFLSKKPSPQNENLPQWLRKKLGNHLEKFKWIQSNKDLYFKENWKRFQVNLSLENRDQNEEIGFSLEGLKNFNHRSYLQDITLKIGDLWFWKYLPLQQIAYGLVQAEKEIIVDFAIDPNGRIQDFSFLKRGIIDIQNQAIEKAFQSVELEFAPKGYRYRSLQMTFTVLDPKPNFSGGVEIRGNILLEGEVQFPQNP